MTSEAEGAVVVVTDLWISCKGNLTDLRRILHPREIQSKYINQVEIIHNTCLAKGNPKRML
jgi:hypothetical protein